MCGIIGAIANQTVTSLLLDGLKRLEYRGYDSAGISIIDGNGQICRVRQQGKVAALEALLDSAELVGNLGIAHTRWATHGIPSTPNAHPHIADGAVAIVHNGIIENHEALREQQKQRGVQFSSETDTETVVHQISFYLQQGQDLLQAVQSTLDDLRGAYALGIISPQEPERLIAARQGSPLVIGVGKDGNYVASDVSPLLPVTDRFLYPEEGDVVELTRDQVTIYDRDGKKVEREIHTSTLSVASTELGPYAHYMQKEIHEQPNAIAETLEGRIHNSQVLEGIFGPLANGILKTATQVQILACGTSYHAGIVARYWFEELLQLPCSIEVASEYRYRNPALSSDTLVVTISQSGETADTLAALKQIKERGVQQTLAICNVAESSLVRESTLTLMTHAGPEIGVASTKAFTTQLTALLLLVLAIGKKQQRFSVEKEGEIVNALETLPRQIEDVLQHDEAIRALSQKFAQRHHALFLGRGTMYPIAMEGALKMKEISYIHAEAYPAGELKHGPLALVDNEMPVIAVAPTDSLMEKLRSNLEEVRARGGELFVFCDHGTIFPKSEQIHPLPIAEPCHPVTAPILFTVPLQLLSYHVALIKGTDVDRPRNLAKSVTVE